MVKSGLLTRYGKLMEAERMIGEKEMFTLRRDNSTSGYFFGIYPFYSENNKEVVLTIFKETVQFRKNLNGKTVQRQQQSTEAASNSLKATIYDINADFFLFLTKSHL